MRDLGEVALRDARAYCRAHPAAPSVLVSSADLLAWLKADDLRPWATLGRDGLTAKRLGDFLRRFGVPATQRREGGEKARGYDRAALLEAAERYCPEPAEHSPPARNVGHAGHLGHAGRADAGAVPSEPPPVPRVPHVPRVPLGGPDGIVLPTVDNAVQVLAVFGDGAEGAA